MNVTLLISVLAYELLLIGGIAFWLTRKSRKAASQDGEFELAGRSLPLAVVAPTMALTVLGTAHILGIFELSWVMGGTALWFGLANASAIAVVCLTTGRWHAVCDWPRSRNYWRSCTAAARASPSHV